MSVPPRLAHPIHVVPLNWLTQSELSLTALTAQTTFDVKGDAHDALGNTPPPSPPSAPSSDRPVPSGEMVDVQGDVGPPGNAIDGPAERNGAQKTSDVDCPPRLRIAVHVIPVNRRTRMAFVPETVAQTAPPESSPAQCGGTMVGGPRLVKVLQLEPLHTVTVRAQCYCEPRTRLCARRTMCSWAGK